MNMYSSLNALAQYRANAAINGFLETEGRESRLSKELDNLDKKLEKVEIFSSRSVISDETKAKLYESLERQLKSLVS